MKEFNFIEGQLIPHGVPVAIASKVSKFALSGRWADVLLLVRDNQRATRILERIRGMR